MEDCQNFLTFNSIAVEVNTDFLKSLKMKLEMHYSKGWKTKQNRFHF